MHNTSFLFNLLSFAGQQYEAAQGCGFIDLSDKKDEVMKKYDAAVFIIADIWTGGDAAEAKKLIDDYMSSSAVSFPSLCVGVPIIED